MLSTDTEKPVLKRFIRIKDVCDVTGLPPSTVYEKMAQGSFPKSFHITPRIVAWLEDEVAAWQCARLSEREVANA
ncbi:AlpA family phage regulatory protein [Methyloceanibacter sp.]|uniref:helix-turn-helix transcriptional regulator n=1 Tax=Methyloceanibacter sp. TaxID=1965321 RepID=UPI002C4FD434|nr:AlpA family phage regulatory protein [Methyloceanibacter sp.]HML93413.1 AlpA family phage regulatory protein [Methyloceanibacter sp.]